MLRGWALRLLALLFLVTTVQGGFLLWRGGFAFIQHPALLLSHQLTRQPAPAQHSHDRGIEIAATASRSVGHGKRETAIGGDDPVTLPTLLVVAIALFYALPLRGSDVARTLYVGLTPEGCHREAGRCPTGPPAFAG